MARQDNRRSDHRKPLPQFLWLPFHHGYAISTQQLLELPWEGWESLQIKPGAAGEAPVWMHQIDRFLVFSCEGYRDQIVFDRRYRSAVDVQPEDIETRGRGTVWKV